MKFAPKTLGLLLACLAIASCGGGGGDGHSAVNPPQSSTIQLTATRQTLPLNVTGSPWFPNSPFSTEVDINWRNPDGTPVSGQDISCSIDPFERASIHILDNVATTQVDESAVDWGNIQVHSDTGHALCWVYALPGGSAGVATLRVGGIDPRTGASVSASIPITIAAGAGGGLPASVHAFPTPTFVYVPNSGGSQNSLVTIQVLDGGNNAVADPFSGNSGYDNVRIEIVGDSGGATLTANSATGPVTGTSVTTHTNNGVAQISFQSGTLQGPIQLRVTVDRADGNVSNGITDPLTVPITIVVSDGQLFNIKITSPDTNAIIVNQVDPTVTTPDTGIPPNPDGTYSLTVSAEGFDRQGNPVIPGTVIRFGVIDEPAGAFNSGAFANQFLIAGNDGDPAEGTTLFTAPTGHFLTGGAGPNHNGAGPGDALIVFGKVVHGAPQGNEDLESALTVANVNSETSLNTTSPFNRNDTSGALVNNGPVLPYVIGRAQHGSITASATTNDLGVAHAQLTYTVSSLGHIAAMWAQGDGIDRVTGGPRRVTDATELVYPGVAPGNLVAFPTPIPGNTTTTVTVCLTDALDSPIQGVPVNFQLHLNGGTGSVDGNGLSGVLDNRTGPDGCVNATVVTNGVPATDTGTADSNSGTLTFSVGSATSNPIDIIVSVGFLNTDAGAVCTDGSATNQIVNVTAFGTDGHALSGASIDAACTGSGLAVAPATATTGSNGTAQFNVSFSNSGPPFAQGTCTFTSGTARSASVTFGPRGNVSPPCP